MSKLWIIGDSFTGVSKEKNYWPEILCSKFKGKNYYVSSKSSRDFQTIIDIFLRNLKDINSEDFVILVLPTLARVRVPRRYEICDVEHCSYELQNHEELKSKHHDFFMGAHAYQPDNLIGSDFELEYPLTGISIEDLDKKVKTNYIINSSNASKQNYIEILCSLKEYLPFELFIWSWENEIESEIITTKNQITKQIGFWHTIHDIWEETNGEYGTKADFHFSEKMHKAFADYLIVKFPQFFNV
jgi:hypothetical protein